MDPSKSESTNEIAYIERSVPEIVADRDRLWCLALLGTLDTQRTADVLERFNDLRGRQKEVLAALR